MVGWMQALLAPSVRRGGVVLPLLCNLAAEDFAIEVIA